MDEQRFLEIIDKLKENEGLKESIGTYQEKILHRIIKYYISTEESFHEKKIGNFVCDIYDGALITEIQIGNFNKLRDKLNYLLPLYPVRIIYPVAHIKWLSWENPQTGEISPQRRSPKKGSVYDFYKELYKIKNFLQNKNLQFMLILVDLFEIRYLDGWSKEKKRGSHRKNRWPLRLVAEYRFTHSEDYYQLIPKGLSDEFTTKDFAQATRLTLRRSYEAISVLRSLQLIKHIKKIGRINYYEIVEKE